MPFPVLPKQTINWAEHPWAGCYGSPEEEYRSLRNSWGLIDFSALEWVRAEGPDAAGFLQGLLTMDVRKLGVGFRSPGWMLDANGKILFGMDIYREKENAFLLQTAPGQAGPLRAQLDRYLIMEQVSLTLPDSILCFSLQGPECKRRVLPAPIAAYSIGEHDRSGSDGLDLAIPRDRAGEIGRDLLALGAEPVGLIALNTARIEAFRPWLFVDVKIGTNPLIYGNRGIAFTKGCYVGQETVAKTVDRGHPPQLLALLRGAGTEVPPQPMALSGEGKNLGEITSAVWSPAYDCPLALARVKFNRAQPSTVLRDEQGTFWTIEKIVSYKG